MASENGRGGSRGSSVSAPGRGSREHRLRMDAVPESLDLVHDLLERVWADEPRVPVPDRMSFETALVEVAGNIVEHACGEGPVHVELTVVARPDRVEASLLDDGLPADLAPGPAEMPQGLEESGRGLALAAAVADEVSYSRAGAVNAWRVVRLLRVPDGRTPMPGS